MNTIKFFKTNNLPAILEPNSLYLVNSSGKLNVHVSNNTGTNSLQISDVNGANSIIPYLTRKSLPKIAGDLTGTGLTTIGLVTRRLYLFPFMTPRPMVLTRLRVNVTTQSSGNVASVGIYNNFNLANGDDNPYQLLASVLNLSMTGTGDKDGIIDFTFIPNTIYWFGVITNGAPILRAVPSASVAVSLGRNVNSNIAVVHLYADLATYQLPDIAPTGLLNGTSSIPAIYLVE